MPDGSAAPAESMLNKPPRATPEGSVIVKSSSVLIPAGNMSQGPTFHTAEAGPGGGAGAGAGGAGELDAGSAVDPPPQPVNSVAQEKKAIFNASRR